MAGERQWPKVIWAYGVSTASELFIAFDEPSHAESCPYIPKHQAEARVAEVEGERDKAEQRVREWLEGERARGAVTDFLDAWRFCPLSQTEKSPRPQLEDAASQLLAAILATLPSTEPSEIRCGGGPGKPRMVDPSVEPHAPWMPLANCPGCPDCNPPEPSPQPPEANP